MTPDDDTIHVRRGRDRVPNAASTPDAASDANADARPESAAPDASSAQAVPAPDDGWDPGPAWLAIAGADTTTEPGETELRVGPDDTELRAGPRRAVAPAPPEDSTLGSTMIVRRESRRRAAREQDRAAHPQADVADTVLRSRGATPPVASGVPMPHGRTARVPGPTADVVYTPRTDRPVIAQRTPPTPQAAQRPLDTARAAASARRASRRRAIVVLAVAVVIALGAAAALLAIVLG